MLTGPQISALTTVTDSASRVRRHGRKPATPRLQWGDGDSITLVAVSKGHPASPTCRGASLGHQPVRRKLRRGGIAQDRRTAGPGHPLALHRPAPGNKTRPIAQHFDWVHGIDRLKVAERLTDQRPSDRPPSQCVCPGERRGRGDQGWRRTGAGPDLLFAVAALPRLQLRGLMCMLPFDLEERAQRAGFRRLPRAAGGRPRRAGVDTLSMGMSGDLEAAVAEGSTLLRIGTALFGPRG